MSGRTNPHAKALSSKLQAPRIVRPRKGKGSFKRKPRTIKGD